MRNNLLKNVNVGVYQNMGGVDTPPATAISIVRQSGLSVKLNLQSINATSFSKGDLIYVIDAQVMGSTGNDNPYNGYFEVLDVHVELGNNFIEYALKQEYSVPLVAGQSPHFVKLWEERQLIVENNTIELKTNLISGSSPTPIGIDLSGQEHISPYVFFPGRLAGR